MRHSKSKRDIHNMQMGHKQNQAHETYLYTGKGPINKNTQTRHKQKLAKETHKNKQRRHAQQAKETQTTSTLYKKQRNNDT